MDIDPPPPPPDPALLLLEDIHLHAVDILDGMLPPPAEDTSESWLLRDQAAIASVACLVPGNPAEGRVAANHVAAMEHASQCLAEAAEIRDDPKQVARLRAQAASMGREARGYLGALQRMQAIRLKRESKDSTRESAAWTEHCLLGNMTQALERLVGADAAGAQGAGWVLGGSGPLAGAPLTNAPSAGAPLEDAPPCEVSPAEASPAEASPGEAHPAEALLTDARLAGTPLIEAGSPLIATSALAAQPAAPIAAQKAPKLVLVPMAAPAPAAPADAPPHRFPMRPFEPTTPQCVAAASPRPTVLKAVDMDEPPRDLEDEVDYYANVYPSRLRLIRRHGGLPPNCTFGPPDPELVRAILASSSPAVLAALDERGSGLE